MDTDLPTSQLLWAAQVGELCGRAGDGLAPEWGFLDVWLELLGAEAGYLTVVRPDGLEQSFSRRLVPGAPRGDAPGVREVRTDDAPARLVVTAAGRTPLAAALAVEIDRPSTTAAVQSVEPLVRRALLRLARGPASPSDAAAVKAWNSAPGPMLLLGEDAAVIAANPAAQRRLKLGRDGSVPPWLRRWLDAELDGGGPRNHANWTAAGDGTEYNLNVLAVDPAEPTPGRWLVSLVRGGPTLSGRLALAAKEFALTPREQETLALLAEGLSNRLIAEALDVTPATVKFHLIRVMKKAGVGTRTELLARLHTLHLVDREIAVPLRALRMRSGYAWQDESGVVFCVMDQGAELDVPDIAEFQDVVGSFATEGPVRVYSDATGVRGSTPAAHKAAGKPTPFVSRLAVRGGSTVSRTLVNLWLRVARPPYPTRLFRDREEALAWLTTDD